MIADPPLRPIALGDVRVLSALHRAVFEVSVQQPWSGTTFYDLLCLPGTFGFLAGTKDTAAGFVLARRAADECEILTLAVLPAARGCGCARALMTAALNEARVCDCVRAFLEVAEDNAAARALYQNLGFAQVGTRPGYYGATKDGPRTDALVLNLDLGLDPGRGD